MTWGPSPVAALPRWLWCCCGTPEDGSPGVAPASAGVEVDEDWNPEWPADWQRHYAALRELVRDEEGPAEVLPGFTVHGMDVGKWLARQQTPQVWQALMDGQRERL